MTKEEIKIQDALGLISYDDKLSIVRNPNTSIEILEYLSRDKHYWIRYYVANNPNTSIEVLKRLSKDEDLWIKDIVKENLRKRKNE